jgi:hypothetical protein
MRGCFADMACEKVYSPTKGDSGFFARLKIPSKTMTGKNM